MVERLWIGLVAVVVVVLGAWVLMRLAELLSEPLCWVLDHVAAAGDALWQRWHQWRRR